MTLISSYPAITAVAPGDLLPIVDIDDTSQSPAGTTHSVTVQALLAEGIDPAAQDLHPAGIAAAGGNGLAADSGHIHPATEILAAMPGSLLAWNFPIWAISGTYQTPGTAGTGGYVAAVAIPVTRPLTVTNVIFFVAGAGASISNAYVGLMNSAGTVVATSAQRSGDSALTTSDSVWTAPLSSPYTITAGNTGIWYGLVLVSVATGGTKPLLGTAQSGTTNSLSLANLGCSTSAPRFAGASSLSTAIPASYTLSSMVQSGTTANAGPYWCALS